MIEILFVMAIIVILLTAATSLIALELISAKKELKQMRYMFATHIDESHKPDEKNLFKFPFTRETP